MQGPKERVTKDLQVQGDCRGLHPGPHAAPAMPEPQVTQCSVVNWWREATQGRVSGVSSLLRIHSNSQVAHLCCTGRGRICRVPVGVCWGWGAASRVGPAPDPEGRWRRFRFHGLRRLPHSMPLCSAKGLAQCLSTWAWPQARKLFQRQASGPSSRACALLHGLCPHVFRGMPRAPVLLAPGAPQAPQPSQPQHLL